MQIKIDNPYRKIINENAASRSVMLADGTWMDSNIAELAASAFDAGVKATLLKVYDVVAGNSSIGAGD